MMKGGGCSYSTRTQPTNPNSLGSLHSVAHSLYTYMYIVQCHNIKWYSICSTCNGHNHLVDMGVGVGKTKQAHTATVDMTRSQNESLWFLRVAELNIYLQQRPHQHQPPSAVSFNCASGNFSSMHRHCMHYLFIYLFNPPSEDEKSL